MWHRPLELAFRHLRSSGVERVSPVPGINSFSGHSINLEGAGCLSADDRFRGVSPVNPVRCADGQKFSQDPVAGRWLLFQ